MTPAHVQQILGDRAIDTVNRFRGFGPLFIAITSFSLIMAALASGGSIIGVMGYAYNYGIPATLCLFAGSIL